MSMSLFAAACGGTAEGYDDTAVAGKLTVGADGMTGAAGKVVVMMVTARGGGGPLLGSVCASVTAGSAKVSATVKAVAGDNPCQGASERAGSRWMKAEAVGAHARAEHDGQAPGRGASRGAKARKGDPPAVGGRDEVDLVLSVLEAVIRPPEGDPKGESACPECDDSKKSHGCSSPRSILEG